MIFISYAEYEDFGDDIMMSPDSVVNDMKVLDIRVSEDTSSYYTLSYQAKYWHFKVKPQWNIPVDILNVATVILVIVMLIIIVSIL